MRVIYKIEVEAEVENINAHIGEFLDIALHYPDWETIRIIDCVVTDTVIAEDQGGT